MDAADAEEAGSSLWKRARFVTTTTVAFATSFRTLRDMVQEAYVEADELQHLEALGEGAFASVALCALQGKPVAVKRLKPSLLQSDRDLTDFCNEIALLKKLRHCAIVEFLGVAFVETPTAESETPTKSPKLRRRAVDFFAAVIQMKNPKRAVEEAPEGEEDAANRKENSVTFPFKSVMLIQEYMTRGTLKGMMIRQMERPLRTVYSRLEGLEWLIQVAQGLRYLHEARPKIVHRDLKPENIMLTMECERVVAKIGDFGLHAVLKTPRHAYPQPEGEAPDDVTLSTENLTKKEKSASIKASYALSGRTGSLMYMAPEVLHCQPYNEKADVFSFALIVYELLSKTMLLCFVSCTGEADEIERHAQAVARGARPEIPSEWPEALRTLVRQCWAQNPQNRPSMRSIIPQLKTMRTLEWMINDTEHKGCCALQ